jgi:deoxyguanosine kinase
MYISIEGVIGVGKTTLARMMQPAFEANLLLEVFEENPFLSNFYANRALYAFQTQMFFLLSRYRQQNQHVPELLLTEKHLISDYTFDKDSLFARINLKGDELEMYYKIHEALAEKIPLPDLIVYLRADTDVLMQRIAMRDRSYERTMEREYIHELNLAYDDYFMNQTLRSKVMVLDCNEMDFVRHPEQIDWIENRIRQVLQLSPYQPTLPI